MKQTIEEDKEPEKSGNHENKHTDNNLLLVLMEGLCTDLSKYWNLVLIRAF